MCPMFALSCLTMKNVRKCLCHCDTFSAGISNGAEWYLVDNGMQDFNYLFSNCLELTAELSCWKRPPTSHLQSEWENNLDSMLAVLESVHTGVKGKVVVAETGEPLDRASVEVVGREKQMVTTYRYLVCFFLNRLHMLLYDEALCSH